MLEQEMKLKDMSSSTGFPSVSLVSYDTKKIWELLIVQARITLFVERQEYSETFTLTKTKQPFTFKRKV